MAQRYATAPTRRHPPQQQMTYEEFLDWADEDTYAEWIDGEIVMMGPASDRHQDIARFLTVLLSLYCELCEIGVIRPAPFQMKLENGREPDLLFVAAEHRDRLKETFLDGPADLVVEIISPESIGRDRGDKFVEYEAGGVPEYWLIDPQREQAEFYRLDDAGRYQPTPLDADGIYRSTVLAGFWLRVSWLWQDDLPSAIHVLGEIAGIDPEIVAAFETALHRNADR